MGEDLAGAGIRHLEGGAVVGVAPLAVDVGPLAEQRRVSKGDSRSL
jgi:hypothetical protein